MNAIHAEVWNELGRISGMLEGASVFSSGRAYWVNGKQVAHFIDDDSIELRLTKPVIRELRAALKADERVDLRGSTSDWVMVRVGSAQDVTFVVKMAERVAEAHRPVGGATQKLPPTGADLERRRRFH